MLKDQQKLLRQSIDNEEQLKTEIKQIIDKFLPNIDVNIGT